MKCITVCFTFIARTTSRSHLWSVWHLSWFECQRLQICVARRTLERFERLCAFATPVSERVSC